MERAGPPPEPPPDPSSTIPPHLPSHISTSIPPPLCSDLNPSSVLAPDLAAAWTAAGHPSSDQDLLLQSSAPIASDLTSSRLVSDPAAASITAGLAAVSASSGSLAAARAPDLAAAGSLSGHLSSAQALPLQPARLPAPSSLSSSCLPADLAAAGSISAEFRVPSTSDFSHPQIVSVLPLLASVLQQPPATSFAIPSSSSLPSPSQSATLHPPSSDPSLACSKEPLDTPLFSAPAQISAPIRSTPGVRFNASTNNSSAIPPNHIPPSHPPTPLSYAQAARQSRGSGFVRTHADDVESFARLPRTGANIICGSKEGIPSFSIVNSDLRAVENLFSNALIMKFQGGRPSLETSHREIQSWGLKHPFSIGPLSSRAFLLRFQDNQDLIRVLTRPSSILITFPYKVYRWHNLCHLKDDSCYAPVWITLPRLPLQCFIPEFLESVANRIGRFLCFDKATTTLARPSAARLCVELDLRITPPPFIWVGLFDGLKQPIIYEKMPKYCGDCHIQGHLVSACPKGQRETPNFQAIHCSMMNRACPPPARQNVIKQSSALHQHPNPSAAFSPNSHLPPPPNPPSSSLPTPPPIHDADTARSHLSTSHSPTPSASLLHRASDATTTSVLLQPQPTAGLLQQALLQPQPSASLQQQDSAAVGPAVAQPPAQQSPSLLQRDPAAAAPSSGHASPHRSASPVQRGSSAAAPSPLPLDPLAISSHSSARMAPHLPHPPPPLKPVPSTSSKSLKGKHKSIKPKPPDVDISSSLSQQQQVALKQFKNKFLEHNRARDQQLDSSTSLNHFEALRYDHSDADNEFASYYSDTDDGCVEPIDMGYQSANGRASNKHKAFAPSGMRINKRHPNMPLHVRLRSRKDSHPSTP